MRTSGRSALSVWQAFLLAHATLVEAIEAELEREHGMPLSWYEVLLRVAEGPPFGMRMQDLARQALLSKSGITRLVDRMEEAGLVCRASCPSDRRGTLAVLTDPGRAALDRARPAIGLAVDRHITSHLTRAEAVALDASLRKLLDAHGVGACWFD